MNWTEPNPPTKDVCPYDHVDCDTPLGLMRIDWKSWKESPSYDIELGDFWIGVEYDLDKAKEVAENYLISKAKELNDYLQK